MSVADVEFLDGRRYVEPAEAGGGGEPVGLASPESSRPRLHRLGRVFCLGQVAQLVEHMTENHGVGSSILPLAIVSKPEVGRSWRDYLGP